MNAAWLVILAVILMAVGLYRCEISAGRTVPRPAGVTWFDVWVFLRPRAARAYGMTHYGWYWIVPIYLNTVSEPMVSARLPALDWLMVYLLAPVDTLLMSTLTDDHRPHFRLVVGRPIDWRS